MDSNNNKINKTEFLIVGGGVAGLSAANRLAEQGASVTLLEAGSYPTNKVCGEFLSSEASPILEKWEIETSCSINKLKFVMPKNEWGMPLPKSGATTLRSSLDEALANRAKQQGANIKTFARVENIHVPKNESEHFVLTLESGEKWQAPTLLVSTGRLINSGKPKFCYVGIKAHFDGIDIEDELVMHLLKGAYFGIAPIGKAQVNVAGIITCTSEQAQNPDSVITSFFERSDVRKLNEILSGGRCMFDSWLKAPIPKFGVRKTPNWPNAFFLGDAAGVIPPATGNGLSMGLTSGILAADYALKNQPVQYRNHWNKEYRLRILTGKLLHKLFISPKISHSIPILASTFPFLQNYLFRKTRGTQVAYSQKTNSNR